MSHWKYSAVVILVAATVMLTNLGGARLWDRDEPRNAGCAAEMLARGDWVVPVFNGELRTHKPVLLYWMIMCAYSVLGVNEFAARLPSALLAIGTAVCTCELGRRFYSARAGMWGGIAVATSLMFVLAGRAATPDATLIFCSTLAMTLFATGVRQSGANTAGSQRRGISAELSWPQAVGVYGSMGLAMLAKGPVGVVLPTATLVLFQLLVAPRDQQFSGVGWRARLLAAAGRFTPVRVCRAVWQLRPFTALVVVLVVAAPWYVWVGLRTDGEFLRGFFLEHNLGRAMNTMEGHRGNLLFYPATLLLGLFPWSVFAVPVAIDIVCRLRRGEEPTAGFLLAACWLTVYLGVFSLAKTKLPSYITPTYPAAAMLLGSFLDRFSLGKLQVPRGWLHVACAVLVSVGVVFMGAIPWVVHGKLPGEEWLGLIGLVPFAAGVVAWWYLRREQPQHVVWTVAGAATAFATLLFALGADRVDRHQFSHRLLRVIEKRSSNPRVTAYACLEPSWVFYGGRPIAEITAGSFGPTHSPFVEVDGKWMPKSPVTIADVASQVEDSFVITTGRKLEAARQLLPEDFQVLETAPLFLKNDTLILLGRPRPVVIARGK